MELFWVVQGSYGEDSQNQHYSETGKVFSHKADQIILYNTLHQHTKMKETGNKGKKTSCFLRGCRAVL